jgi:hypothetical protein
MIRIWFLSQSDGGERLSQIRSPKVKAKVGKHRDAWSPGQDNVIQPQESLPGWGMPSQKSSMTPSVGIVQEKCFLCGQGRDLGRYRTPSLVALVGLKQPCISKVPPSTPIPASVFGML